MVSAIIPARNEEASIAQAVETVAAQVEVEEVIAVNDQSSDGTGAILAGLAARIPKLKVMETGELPAGWVGKNYAASVGAAAAQGDWLLFTDADTYHFPGSTRQALADAEEHEAALVSYSPEQEMETWWERALIPVVYCQLSGKFSYARVNNSRSPDAAANGQFLMIAREVYQRLGGHGAVAGDILEDVALARRVKQAGFRIYFTAGAGAVRTRMYHKFRDMWQGWTKNLYSLLGGNSLKVFGDLLVVAPWLEAFFLLLGAALNLTAIRFHNAPVATLAHYMFLYALVLLAARHIRYGVSLHRNRYPISYIRYYAPGVCLYSAALIASWWKTTRGSVVWKGRAYQARTP